MRRSLRKRKNSATFEYETKKARKSNDTEKLKTKSITNEKKSEKSLSNLSKRSSSKIILSYPKPKLAKGLSMICFLN